MALDVADLEETEDGFKIIIRRSKTDQDGHGETIAIARGVTTCPVKAVKAWLQAAGISEGRLFRPVAKGGRLIAQRLEAEAVCDIVQAYAKRLGLKGAGTFDGIPASWRCCSRASPGGHEINDGSAPPPALASRVSSAVAPGPLPIR